MSVLSTDPSVLDNASTSAGVSNGSPVRPTGPPDSAVEAAATQNDLNSSCAFAEGGVDGKSSENLNFPEQQQQDAYYTTLSNLVAPAPLLFMSMRINPDYGSKHQFSVNGNKIGQDVLIGVGSFENGSPGGTASNGLMETPTVFASSLSASGNIPQSSIDQKKFQPETDTTTKGDTARVAGASKLHNGISIAVAERAKRAKRIRNSNRDFMIAVVSMWAVLAVMYWLVFMSYYVHVKTKYPMLQLTENTVLAVGGALDDVAFAATFKEADVPLALGFNDAAGDHVWVSREMIADLVNAERAKYAAEHVTDKYEWLNVGIVFATLYAAIPLLFGAGYLFVMYKEYYGVPEHAKPSKV